MILPACCKTKKTGKDLATEPPADDIPASDGIPPSGDHIGRLSVALESALRLALQDALAAFRNGQPSAIFVIFICSLWPMLLTTRKATALCKVENLAGAAQYR